MIRQRPTFVLAVVVGLALALVACGGGQPAGGQPTVPVSGHPTIIPTQPPLTRPAGMMAFPTRAPAATETPQEAPTATETPAEAATPAVAGEPVVIEAMGGTVESLVEAWDQVYALEPGVPFTITTTETEVEAVFNARLAETTIGENFSNVNVTFSDGQITIAFTTAVTINETTTEVDAQFVFVPSIDSEGHLVLTATSAQLGRFEMSDEFLDAVSQSLAASLAEAREEAEVSVTLTEVTVAAGQLTISGYINPQ